MAYYGSGAGYELDPVATAPYHRELRDGYGNFIAYANFEADQTWRFSSTAFVIVPIEEVDGYEQGDVFDLEGLEDEYGVIDDYEIVARHDFPYSDCSVFALRIL